MGQVCARRDADETPEPPAGVGLGWIMDGLWMDEWGGNARLVFKMAEGVVGGHVMAGCVSDART